MSNNDALNKIENIVNNAISSQLKTIKDQADENETKIQFTIKELHSMLSAINMEIQHIKERLDRVGTVFANPDEETKAAPTVKRAKKKAAAAAKVETDGSEKVKTITDFCSWKWITDEEFRNRYNSEDNMAKINTVANVKNAKDDQTRLKNEGRAFYSKIVNAKGASANTTLQDEIKKSFEEFRKPFDDLKIDDRDSAAED